MTDSTQPEALRLADELEFVSGGWGVADQCCAELRRQHAENTALQQGYDAPRLEIEALRARCVEPAGAQQPGTTYAGLPTLFREALAWGMTYGPEIPAHQWDEMRESMVKQYTERASHEQAPAQAAPAAVAEPVAYRVLRKRHDGEWVTDGRAWCDGVPTQDLVDDIALRSDGWRIEYAFAAPTTQAAPVAQGDAASTGFFLQLPQRPKPEAPAGTVGLDWDAYSGAQMLAYGRDCSNAAIVSTQKQGCV